jgi:DNA-binding LacI/PurR family transcriptional regulator
VRRIALLIISAGRLLPSVPSVETDDAQIARRAAEHFLDNGFQHFALRRAAVCERANDATEKRPQAGFRRRRAAVTSTSPAAPKIVMEGSGTAATAPELPAGVL